MKLRNLAVVLFKLQHQIWVLSYIQILVLAYIDITGEGENILQITLAAFLERFSEENAVEGEFILILLCILLVSH